MHCVHTCPGVEIHNTEDGLVAVQGVKVILHHVGLPCAGRPHKQHWPPALHEQIHQVRESHSVGGLH